MNTTKKLAISYNIDEILDAIKYLYPEKGTLYNPFPLDNFIKNDLKGLQEIKLGEHITITLESDSLKDEQPKFCYCKIRNITKDSKDLVTKKDWSKYYHFDKDDNKTIITPDGCLFVKPINNQINITAAKAPKLMNLSYIYFSYTLVLNFTYRNKKYYFIIDPIAKISSRH